MKDNYYEEDFNKNIKKLTNIRKNNKSSLVKNKKKWYNILAKMYEVLGVVHAYPRVQLRGRRCQMASEKMCYRLNVSVDERLGEVSIDRNKRKVKTKD